MVQLKAKETLTHMLTQDYSKGKLVAMLVHSKRTRVVWSNIFLYGVCLFPM